MALKVINGGQRIVVDKTADEATGLRAFAAYMAMNKAKTSITIGPNVPDAVSPRCRRWRQRAG